MEVLPLVGFVYSVYLVLLDCSGHISLSYFLVRVAQENWVRECFWGALHGGSSKINKENRGERRGSKSIFTARNEVGGGTRQSAMPRLSIEPSVRYFWHTVWRKFLEREE